MGRDVVPLAFAVVGGFVGGLFTAGAFSSLGASVGYALGSAAVGQPGALGAGSGSGAPTLEGSSYDVPIPEFAGVVGGVRGNVITVAKNKLGEDAGVVVVTKKKKARGKGGGKSYKEETYFLIAEFLIGRALGGSLFSPEPLFVDKIEMEEGAERKCIFDRDGETSEERGYDLVQTISGITGRVICETSDELRLYTGTDEQLPDAALLEFYPDGLCAHRGCAKVVFNRLEITSQPTFVFTVRSETTGRRALISQRLQNVGIPAARLELSAISGDAQVKGKQVVGAQSAREFCEKTARPVFGDFAFDGARIVATSRLTPFVHDIEIGEIGAISGSDNGDTGTSESANDGRLQIKARAQEEMCSEAKVSFWDENNGYETGSAGAVQSRARHSNVLEYDLSEVSDLESATHLARAIRDEDALQDEEARFKVLGGRETWLAGDVVRLPRGVRAGEESLGKRDALLLEIGRESGGILDCMGMPYAGHVYEQSGAVSGPVRAAPRVRVFAPPLLFAENVVALSERDPDTISEPGLLVVTSQRSYRNYKGVDVRVGTSDNDDKYGFVTMNERGTIGELTADFDPASETSFAAKTLFGEMEDMASGAAGLGNLMCFKGGLLVRFDFAIVAGYDPDEDEVAYSISGASAGLYGSDYAISRLAGAPLPAGTRFVLLRDADGETAPGVTWISMPSGAIGQSVRVDARSNGTRGYDPTTLLDLTFEARNRMALSPRLDSALRGESDGSLTLLGGARNRFAADDNDPHSGLHRMSEPRFGAGYKFQISLDDGAISHMEIRFSNDDEGDFSFGFSASQLEAIFGAVPDNLSGGVALFGTYGVGAAKLFETTWTPPMP